MRKWRDVCQRAKRLGSATILMAALSLAAPSFAQEKPAPLSARDVSILFPVPKDAGDLRGFISVADLKDAAGDALIPEPLFRQFLAVASDASKIAGPDGGPTQIGFPDNVMDTKAWFVAGIRIDAGAPGLAPNVASVFGQIPQVRLVLQPVTVTGGAVKVHDRAAHMIFSFATPSAAQETCPIARMIIKFDPSVDRHLSLLKDIVALRDDLAKGVIGGAPITTDGPLDVHPALANSAARKPFRDRLMSLLGKNLTVSQLGSMAAMGLPKTRPDPWIFIAMQWNPQSKKLEAVPSPAFDGAAKAALVRFFGSKKVLPDPKSDNTNTTMTTCFRPPQDRQVVSTATLLNNPAATEQETIDITGIIADPAKSHFFNTDCVSCHTETRLLRSKSPTTQIAGVAEQVLPNGRWNVRNFGWGPEGSGFKPTVVRRTATETDEVVKAVNDLLRQGKQQQ